jgi:hypothetical protein
MVIEFQDCSGNVRDSGRFKESGAFLLMCHGHLHRMVNRNHMLH